MSLSEIQSLVETYKKSLGDSSYNERLMEIGSSFDQKKVASFLETSISEDLRPDDVLSAVMFSLNEDQVDLISYTISTSIKHIDKWTFATDDTGELFTNVLRRVVPQVLSAKRCFKLLCKIFQLASDLKGEENNRRNKAEKLFSLIPPLYLRLWNEPTVLKVGNEESNSRDFCKRWLNESLDIQISEYAIPFFIDTLSDFPLTEDFLSDFLEYLFSKISFSSLPVVAERVFALISENKKLINKCVRKFISTLVRVEEVIDEESKLDFQRVVCHLIRSIYNAASCYRVVLEVLTSMLTSKTELPNNFSPFILSLSLYMSKLRPKIYNSLFEAFEQYLRDDYQRKNKKYLKHIKGLFSDYISCTPIEVYIREAIDLTHISLEGNIRYFIDFAFGLIDRANLPNDYTSTTSSEYGYSDFLDPGSRQMEIGIQILDQSIRFFTAEIPVIFRNIKQRILFNRKNCSKLVRLLDTPGSQDLSIEVLMECCERMIYLDRDTIEELMKCLLPKLNGTCYVERLFEMMTRSFFSRSDEAKINSLTAMFYLIHPRESTSFSQQISSNRKNEIVKGVQSSDISHEVFGLLQRALTQSFNVQVESYSLIPLLLSKNEELYNSAYILYSGLLKKVITNSDFPLIISPDLPLLLQSLSDVFLNLPNYIKEKEQEWNSLRSEFDSIVSKITNIEFMIFEDMDLISNIENKDIILHTISILFNYSLRSGYDDCINIYNTYEKLAYKFSESEKNKKSTLKSPFNYKHPINLDLIEKLFKKIDVGGEDFSRNYGVQLYTLRIAEHIIHEIPYLRLNYRSERLDIIFKMGKFLMDSIVNIKWYEPSSGFKNPINLYELTTDMYKNLFLYVFGTYSADIVKRFLTESLLIDENGTFNDAQNNFYNILKEPSYQNRAKCFDNLSRVLERLSYLGTLNAKLYSRITKLFNRQLQEGKVTAGKVLKLSFYFSESSSISWLKETTNEIVQTLNDEDTHSSSSIKEVILYLGSVLTDFEWAINNWIGKVAQRNLDQSSSISSKISIFLLDIGNILNILISVNYNFLQIRCYEEFVKHLKEYLHVVHTLLKKTSAYPSSGSDELNELVKFVTSSFGSEVSNFNIKTQGTFNREKINKKEEIDSKHTHYIIYNLENIFVETEKLIKQDVIDPSIKESFCKIRGTDVRLKKSKKKKHDVTNETEEIQTNQEENIGDDNNSDVHDSAHSDNNEPVGDKESTDSADGDEENSIVDQ